MIHDRVHDEACAGVRAEVHARVHFTLTGSMPGLILPCRDLFQCVCQSLFRGPSWEEKKRTKGRHNEGRAKEKRRTNEMKRAKEGRRIE